MITCHLLKIFLIFFWLEHKRFEFSLVKKPRNNQFLFRKFSVDGWRSVFSSDQITKINGMIADVMFEKFYWQK